MKKGRVVEIEGDKAKGPFVFCKHPAHESKKSFRYFVGKEVRETGAMYKRLCGCGGVVKSLKIDAEVPEGAWVISKDKTKGTMRCFVPDEPYREYEVQRNYWTIRCVTEEMIDVNYDLIGRGKEYDLHLDNCRSLYNAVLQKHLKEKEKEQE